jgi:hypothetical protein
MDSEPEFFEELPRRAKPNSRFGEIRVDKKIIPKTNRERKPE